MPLAQHCPGIGHCIIFCISVGEAFDHLLLVAGIPNGRHETYLAKWVGRNTLGAPRDLSPFDLRRYTSRHGTLIQCCLNAGPASQMVDQS